MSYVTNLIVCLSASEDEEQIAAINAFFTDDLLMRRGTHPMTNVYDLPYGGNKGLECTILVGAFNYLDLDAFLKYLNTIDFASKETVQVFHKQQNEDKFTLIYGVQGYDARMVERDNLLIGAEDLLLSLERFIPTEDWMDIKNWLERYKQMRGEE